jgi:hypothetical protein
VKVLDHQHSSRIHSQQQEELQENSLEQSLRVAREEKSTRVDPSKKAPVRKTHQERKLALAHTPIPLKPAHTQNHFRSLVKEQVERIGDGDGDDDGGDSDDDRGHGRRHHRCRLLLRCSVMDPEHKSSTQDHLVPEKEDRYPWTSQAKKLESWKARSMQLLQ